jgi:hemerythrin-like domain-containing protein
MEADPASDEWTDTFEKMQHRYLHHIDEEEEEMFPEAAETLSGEEEARIAKVFEDRKPKELQIAAEDKPGDERD